MAKIALKFDSFADGAALRKQLTDLTRDRDGDGSSSQCRAQVLMHLRQVSDEGRKRAEKMLLEDGSGSACAARLSYLRMRSYAAYMILPCFM